MRRFRNTVLPLLLFGVFFGSALLDAAPVRLRSIWAAGRRSVHLLDAASGLGATVSRSAAQIALSRGKERLVFYPDRRYAAFNSVRVNLCYPLLMQKTNPYLAKVDYDNLLVPFLGTRLPYKHKIGRIVIDPGHGGRDRGTAGQHLQEKTITLNLANRVANILRAYGYKVELTRTRDATLSLGTRSAYANKRGADLFVSIHVNSAADRSVRGIETFCLTPEGAASSNSGKPVASAMRAMRRIRTTFCSPITCSARCCCRPGRRIAVSSLPGSRCCAIFVVPGRWSRSASSRTAATRRTSAVRRIRTSSRVDRGGYSELSPVSVAVGIIRGRRGMFWG